MKKNMNKKDVFGNANYSEQIKSLAKTSIIVVVILAIVYFATAFATGEIKLGKEKEEVKESEIQYEEIIAGQIMNRIDKEYYVILFAYTSDEASTYLSLKQSYLQNTEALPVYLVDLDKNFNQSIIAKEDEEYKKKPNKVTDLKVNGTTILKVKDGKVTERIEGDDKVEEYLEKIS